MRLLLLLDVAAVIYLAIRKFSQKASSPIDVLKSRYSRGEIDRNEYEQKKKDLES